MSLGEIEALLTAPGQRFEYETVDIRGVPTKAWKNAPASLALLTAFSRSHGAREFLIHEDERVTYDAHFRAVTTLAHKLIDMGIGKGDRVAFAMRNLPEWTLIFFATTAIGAIAVPLNAWWTGAELEYGINDSGSKLLILDGERHERLKAHYPAMPGLERILVTRPKAPLEAPAEDFEPLVGPTSGWATLEEKGLPPVAMTIRPDDDVAIFYTSGTTGQPKGALGTHRNMLSNIFSTGYGAARMLLRRGEVPPAVPEPKVNLIVIPFFHVTACSAFLMGNMVAGGTIVLMRKWDATEALKLIEKERINATGGVPTIAWQLLEHPDRAKYDLTCLESIAYGGAPSAPELVRRIYEEFGALPGNGWGMTETMATVTSHQGEDYLNRPDSCGPAVPVAELKVMSPDGDREMPVGEVGELWAKGPMVVKGYWNKPEATAQTFIDGWVRTGDLARLDEEGFCYIVDRAKDIIIRGGENIYSIEVENVLYAHPAVTDAALVGVPHKTLGEEPAAVVHLCSGCEASEEELQAWVGRHLAAFKVPVAVRFVDHVLPRNANGKILKNELKAMFAGA
jgi:long-chain acyl-CoA synthetase